MDDNLQKITVTKSSLYFRECKACGCVTLHIGKTTPQMPPGSTYNGVLLKEPRGEKPPKAEC